MVAHNREAHSSEDMDPDHWFPRQDRQNLYSRELLEKLDVNAVSWQRAAETHPRHIRKNVFLDFETPCMVHTNPASAERSAGCGDFPHPFTPLLSPLSQPHFFSYWPYSWLLLLSEKVGLWHLLGS